MSYHIKLELQEPPFGLWPKWSPQSFLWSLLDLAHQRLQSLPHLSSINGSRQVLLCLESGEPTNMGFNQHLKRQWLWWPSASPTPAALCNKQKPKKGVLPKTSIHKQRFKENIYVIISIGLSKKSAAEIKILFPLIAIKKKKKSGRRKILPGSLFSLFNCPVRPVIAMLLFSWLSSNYHFIVQFKIS